MSRTLPYTVLIPHDRTLWCVERFTFLPAPATPHAADWDACQWQVQLETFVAATIGGPMVLSGDAMSEPALRSISLSVGSLLLPRSSTDER